VSVRIAELAIAAEYAELIALGVGERHPSAAVRSPMIGKSRSPTSTPQAVGAVDDHEVDDQVEEELSVVSPAAS
jgi:hypothetical protein